MSEYSTTTTTVSTSSTNIDNNLTLTGTFTLDGYVINPNNASLDQILAYDGYAFVPTNIRKVLCSGSVPVVTTTGNYPDSTFVVTGTDAAGLIQWNTGNNVNAPGTSSLMFTLTFTKPKLNPPIVILTPASLQSTGVSGWQITFDQVTVTSFTPFIYLNNFAANTTYYFWYIIAGE